MPIRPEDHRKEPATVTGHPTDLHRPGHASAPTPTDQPPHPPERATYTVPEVAALLGISTAVVYELLNRGQIPARRLGNRWIIARHRFHTWLNTPDQTDPDDGAPPGGGVPRQRSAGGRR